VFKALSPSLRRFVDFQEVEVFPRSDGSASLRFRLKSGESFQYGAEWRRLYVLPCRKCKSESDEDGSSSSSSSSSSSTATLKESSSEPEAYWLTAVHLTGPVRAAYDPCFK
jgi:hypothetical protein